MLIINADDFGRDTVTTNNIVMCFRKNLITSTSAMVFMQDSERAACVALEHNLEVGLHLNLDEQFTGTAAPGLLRGDLTKVGTFLTSSKFSQVIYNPMLQSQFEYLFKAEYEEFLRLYRRPPAHINGHHHRHLCSNVLLGKIIPDGSRVRRSFTFERGERNIANRLYRRFVDSVVKRRFITTDMFFAAIPSEQLNILKKHIGLAKIHNVELMVHLSSQTDVEYLMQQGFIQDVHQVSRGTYRDLPGTSASIDTEREGEFLNR
jgi:predicted glycoside hydrolase/deacetylase ChbG (UPF0249 family)